MGDVYRADDLRLGQPVALKFLPSDLIHDQRRLDLLVSEVRIGRQVSHPNVCRLFDLVELQGHAFIAMEFIEGEDLGALLRKVGSLPPDRALRIVRDIAAGLAAAHDLGVVHRDLKPANVMIDRHGAARIADFGLAVVGDERAPGAGAEVAGTPAYMSPEQLEGRPATSRSDLYALGLIALEMLGGTRLYEAASLDDLRRLHREPKPRLSDLAGGIDAAFERAVLSVLQEDAEARPATAQDLLRLLPVASDSRPPRSSGPGSGTKPSFTSIAVLPFDSLTAGQDDDLFAVGLADEILSDLTKIGALRVTSRASAMRFRGTGDLAAAARELSVEFLLTGSVQIRGSQLRVTANLIDADGDRIAWSEKFGGITADLFDIQEQVARAVATRLKGQLSADESRAMSQRPIPHPLAFEYYLKARSEAWKFTREGLDAALGHLRRGTELVGDNLLFMAATANVHWQYFNAGHSADLRHLEQASELGRRILALDPDSPHGHRIVGLVAMSRGDVREALRHLHRAAALDPNDAEVLAWTTALYCFAGLSDLAVPMARRLGEIDPASSMSYFARIFLPWIRGRWTEAAAAAADAAAHEPSNAAFFWVWGYVLALAGRIDAARQLAAGLEAPLRDEFFSRLLRVLVAALAGDKPGTDRILTPDFLTAAWNDLQYSLNVAEVWTVLGEHERAFEWLGNAIARGFTDTAFLGTHNRLLQPLWGDARFTVLVDDARRRSQALRDELAPSGGAV